VFITKLNPFFSLENKIVNCASIINFFDSSWIDDPCTDTCADGTIVPPCDEIIAWEWDFGDGTRKSILEDPSHNFTSGGFFDVKLKVWSKLGCIDSITQRIYIPGPQPEFEFELAVRNINDTAIICVGDTVGLKNISQGDVNTPKFLMDWGDSTFTTPPGIGNFYRHQYNKAGTFELYLIQEDEVPGSGIRCSRIFPDTNPDLLIQHKIIVIVRPNPDVEITAVPETICPGDEIVFTATTLDDRYERLKWQFEHVDRIDSISGIVPQDTSVTVTYKDAGTYYAILAPEYDIIPRCWDRDTIEITVIGVTADFDIDSSAAPEFCFTNKSINGDTYLWTFEDDPVDGPPSTDVNPCYNWDNRKGSFKVCLETTSPEGCVDDTCKIINNTFFRNIEFFNVFTPEGDDQNNEFIVKGESIEIFEMKIFNRWGERVFETTDINVSWNGQVNNTGATCPEGTYFYIANYKFLFGVENEGLGPVEGTVDIIRQK
jgi:gliding motility-associated-like protein